MPVDPCFLDLLSDPRNIVRPPPAHVSMDKVRRAADGAMAQGDAPQMARLDDGLVSLDGRDIAIRHYRPTAAATLPVILFCHGGGFVWGSIDTHDGLCRRLAARTGAAVISVAYRLAPETRFPGPVEDVLGVLRDVMARPQDYGIDKGAVALCGDSAGGGICVSVAALARREGLALCHLGLFYPALDAACDTPSQHARADGPLLTRAAMQWFWSCYLGPSDSADHGLLPDRLHDLAAFPPCTIAIAEFDPLCDEGARFASRLTSSGIDAELTLYPGMVHGFLSLPVTSPIIDAAFQDMSRRLRASFTSPPQQGR